MRRETNLHYLYYPLYNNKKNIPPLTHQGERERGYLLVGRIDTDLFQLLLEHIPYRFLGIYIYKWFELVGKGVVTGRDWSYLLRPFW